MSIFRYILNGHTFIGAKVPTLYSSLTVNETEVSNPTVYGDVNPYIFKYGEVVEVVMNNLHSNLVS
jgi:iron transport multicopper oxidase